MSKSAVLAVLIPSRLDRRSGDPQTTPLFLVDAVASIRRQELPDGMQCRIVVGLDVGTALPPDFPGGDDLEVAWSDGRSQGAALNAAAAVALRYADYITFLEDDDTWADGFAACALQAVATRDFVSSTQLEVDEDEAIIRINDFPTPSGWFMPAATFQAVGTFDTSFRWHLDNDWLGRLNKLGARRGHLIEATAPASLAVAQQVRPWLANVARATARTVDLVRHRSPCPLVTRRVHGASGMSRIARGGPAAVESQAEYGRLGALYGGIPW